MKNLKYKIFDNKGITQDRYTLVTSEGDVYGFDDDPFHPLGFGQYSHTLDEYNPIRYYHLYVSKEIGEIEISINDLSENAKRFVLDRICKD